MILAVIPIAKLKEMLRFNQSAKQRRLFQVRMSVVSMPDGRCVMALGKDSGLEY